MLAVEVEGARYGSDKSGLLCAFVFEPLQPGRAIDTDGVERAVARQHGGLSSTFVWAHFNLSNQASLRWMRDHLNLPAEFFDSLVETKSTRIEPTDYGLIGVMNDVTWFGAEPSEVSRMIVCADGRLIVTARHTPLRSVDRLRERIKHGRLYRSALELFADLLGGQAEILANIVRETATRVDELEDRIFANRINGARPALGGLRRVLVRLQRLLAPEPSALFRMLGRPPQWMPREDLEELRQGAEALASAIGDCAALVERVRSLQEEVSAAVEERTNRTVFVLTVVTVATLPMNIIPQMFGMNVGGVPLKEWGWGFWFIDALVTVMAVAITLPLVWRREDG
jgi:zinc transporter